MFLTIKLWSRTKLIFKKKELTIWIKMDVALNNLERLICHKTQPTNQATSGIRFVAQGFILMQDNDPKLISTLWHRYTKTKEEQHILQLKFWPAQSGDINLIEMVWDEHDSKVGVNQPTSEFHFWQCR